MSLPRVSYLESWEQHPPPLVCQSSQRDHESTIALDAGESPGTPQILDPTTLLSSSFPSTFGHRTIRHKLSFNPYAGPAWGHSSAVASEEDRRSLLRSDTTDDVRDVPTIVRDFGSDPVRPEYVFSDSGWDVAPTTGAYEISKGRRIAQVTAAVIYCLFAAGLVFGFAALKPVLIQEGIYRDHCAAKELENGDSVCYEQEMRLNLMFTIAAVVTNVCALPVGTILDSYGPRVCGIAGSIFLAMGALLFGFATLFPFDAYILGYLFLALGGPFVFISSFHLSNTFPARSGLILSMLTGAFDASCAVFLVFRVVHEKTDGGFSLRKFFVLYLIVPIFIFIVQIFLMPDTSYKTASELVQHAEENIADEVNDAVDESIPDHAEREQQRLYRRLQRQSIVSEIQNLLVDGSGDGKVSDLNFDIDNPEVASHKLNQTIQKQSPAKTEHIQSAGGVWGVMHGASALQQIRSPWFILITLFTVLQMLRINYFVATIRSQYDYLLSSPDLARQLNQAFDLLLPLGGLISIPFIGTVLDMVATPTVLLLLVAVATTIGVIGCIPNSLAAGYANIALFVIYRPFYYTAVSDYAAKVFGFQTFGKVYGLIICLAGIGNFVQAALDTLTFKVFARNPIPVNVLLTVISFLVGLMLVGFVQLKAMALSRASFEIEANNSAGTVDSNNYNYASEREPLICFENTNGNESSYGSTGPR
ncbi:hypothetical protein Egran_00954 [Elaphomyces granulatus]|uniref:Major facilitator superfamily (MFS) profile domain-containing protein n=1 Tax=Elaphomyces granulatus TaxID=519963 RepID=A0A232M4E0_9EURO|nr:hypothetical protein Egran_00954 [Elaphomyces granulatus]